MPETNKTLPPTASFGQRLRHYRDRSGKTRTVVGGLMGRSAEWVKALETGRLGQPRLPMLIRLADALDVDLADLTGETRLSRATYAKHADRQLREIRAALVTYPITADDPVTAEALTSRVAHAWRLWHTSDQERSAIAPLLPGLLADGATAARALEGRPRRAAARQLAQINHLAQLYCSHQPAAELVYMTGDRGMLAAQDADDPAAMAGAAWYLNHVWRDAGEAAEARVDLAHQVARMLRPAETVEQRSLYALMHLAIALSHAKLGRAGDAWRHHGEASRAAESLAGFVHPWLMIGSGVVDHYAVTILLDLQQPGLAVEAASRVDPAAVPSRTRQSRYLVEVARAHHRQRDEVAAAALLGKARASSSDTLEFSPFARSIVAEMMPTPPAAMADEVRDLAGFLRLA